MNRLAGTLLGVGVLLSGCDSHENKAPAVSVPPAKMSVMTLPSQAAPITSTRADEDETAIADKASGPVLTQPATASPRKLVYRADIDIKVASLPRAAARVDSLVRGSGSWVGSAVQARSDEVWEQRMVLRVRPEQFTRLLAGLSSLGTVDHKSVESEDVTAEHADVAARLRTKRALEQRYTELLARARKVSEVLEIEAKIGETREEIEATESRLKTLNDQVAYSTITLKLYQPLVLPAPDAPVLSFTSRLAKAFYGGWELITGLVIGTVYLWPLLLLGGAIFWLVRRWRLRQHEAA